MIALQKNTRKISIVLLIFISVTLFTNIANAGTVTNDFSTVFNFINKNIVVKVKNDFCKNYILSVSTGEWKEGEFRTNLGKKVCTSYTVSRTLTGKLATTTIQPLNGSNTISQTENPSVYSINNPTPDVYVPEPSISGADLNIRQIISFTNTERKNNDSNLVALKENSILKNVAAMRVKDMFTNQYFEHNSPTGDNASKEADKNNYTYITIGENIALGNFEGSQGLVTAWMNSPGHRANIMNKNYTEIGVYATTGTYNGKKVWIAAQIFGKPIGGCLSPDVVLKDKITKYKVSADNMMSTINSIDTELKTATLNTQIYNSKVAERNTLAGLYNNLALEIKTTVAEYNKEVAVYNACIKTI